MVVFWGEGKPQYPEKVSRCREENQQTQPTFDAGSGNQTRATLVGGECSHHCAIPASGDTLWHLRKTVKTSSSRYIEYGQSQRREAQKHSCNKFPLFSASSDMLEWYKWQEIIHRYTSFAKYLSICGVGTAVISRYLVSASVNVQPAGSRLNGFQVIVPLCLPKNWSKSWYLLRFKRNLCNLLEIKGLSIHIQLTCNPKLRLTIRRIFS